jgi:SAM-dependent methyltransferase
MKLYLESNDPIEDTVRRAPESDEKQSDQFGLGIDLCRFRLDDDLFKQQKKFVKYFLGAPGPVADLGCGRGVMLELLRKERVDSYGIDTFRPGLEMCREKGLTVVDCDLFSHLRDVPTSSLGGIFCSHVIEHMTPNLAMVLLRESVRILRPGGTLVLVTPNSKDLLVVTEGFWLDLTHVRLYPARLLGTLLEQVGFNRVQTLEDKDTRYSKTFYKRVGGFIRRLWFWGLISRGDVIVVARK